MTKYLSVMEIEIITKEDLHQFRLLLLRDLKELLGKYEQSKSEWLKSTEVRNLLQISPGTLQNLRVNGTLRYTKVGGVLYYKYEDILKLLEGNSSDKERKRV
jgi:hypothetical protein